MANVAVFGIYPTREDAQSGVAGLKAAGFRQTDISVLLPENPGSKDLAPVKSNKSSEAGFVGAIVGALCGGVLGWLASMGKVAIPTLGSSMLAAGPFVAVLAGIGACGIVGALIGVCVGMGIPQYEVKRYEGRLRNGRILLSVHADDADWAKRGKKLLAETGAEHIAATAEERGDYANADRPRLR